MHSYLKKAIRKIIKPHETQQLANQQHIKANQKNSKSQRNSKYSWKQIYEKTPIVLYGNYKVSTVCSRDLTRVDKLTNNADN